MNVIYVDDERPALENFKFTVDKFSDVDSLVMFQDGEMALEYAKLHRVDIAFLDMQMPGIHGLDLAVKLHEIDSEIMVVFVTAYSQYALDAWDVEAAGYLLKPYMIEDIRKHLDKCEKSDKFARDIVIETIPSLSLTVKGKAVQLRGVKTRELFALLVEKGTSGLSPREGIAYLWPDRPNEENTQSLFRVTYKRVVDALSEAGVEDLLTTSENRRYLQTDRVDCDLYRILAGDERAAKKYNGVYLQEYSWSEERNAQLHHMLMGDDAK
ncbi:MAG: response regulator [Bacillota bacterium]|nr:response regulator [Bacillota bacterium]